MIKSAEGIGKIPAKFAFYSAVSLAILTVLTFGLAMIAIPPSGPYCPGNCMEYPYSELLNYYPRDYYWMYLAVFQLFASGIDRSYRFEVAAITINWLFLIAGGILSSIYYRRL